MALTVSLPMIRDAFPTATLTAWTGATGPGPGPGDGPQLPSQSRGFERIESRVTLQDGRSIGIAEQGDPAGFPILFFHGFAGSRLQSYPDASVAQRLGVRVLALDRPGIGLSDPKPGRRVLDWADDVAEVAARLEITRFGVLGWSAGGPHALACAFRMPDRVMVVGLVCPNHGWFIGPGASRQGGREARSLALVARLAPWVLSIVFGRLRRRILADPERVVDQQMRRLPESDRAILARADVRRMMVETLGEAFRTSTQGVRDDVLAAARPWGFDLATVTTPVRVWYGDADTTIPPAAVEELLGRLPACACIKEPGEGHFLLFAHWEEILRSLLAAKALHRGSAHSDSC